MSGEPPRPGSELIGVVKLWIKVIAYVLALSFLAGALRWGGFPWTETAGVVLTVAALWWGQSYVFRAVTRRRYGGGGRDRAG